MMNLHISTYEIPDTYYMGIDVHKKSWKIGIRYDGRDNGVICQRTSETN